MGFREFSKRFFAGRDSGVDPGEETEPFAFLDRVSERVPISSVVPRQNVTVAGFVLTLEASTPDEPPKVTALLEDESGTLEVVWLARRAVPGVEVGTALVVSGTVVVARRVFRIIDPAYTILEEDAL